MGEGTIFWLVFGAVLLVSFVLHHRPGAKERRQKLADAFPREEDDRGWTSVSVPSKRTRRS